MASKQDQDRIDVDIDGRLDVQTLLRGVVPDSFPSQLSAAPAQPGERRLVAIDDNVYRLYGKQIHQVCHPGAPLLCPQSLIPALSQRAAYDCSRQYPFTPCWGLKRSTA